MINYNLSILNTMDIVVKFYKSFNCTLVKIQGKRIQMQDYNFIDGNKDYVVLAVFDGHGDSDISSNLYNYIQFIKNIIIKIKKKGSIENVLTKLFLEIDTFFLKTLENKHQGSTSTIVFIFKKVICISLFQCKIQNMNIVEKVYPECL